MNHISFPSIEHYKSAVKYIRDSAKYHGVSLPVVKFIGTEKLHGTNSAICYDPLTNEAWAQSRERVLSLTQDNAGFCAFATQYSNTFKMITDRVEASTDKQGIIQVYGEWCGGNIQKGVGLNHLSKMFVVFGIRVSENAESNDWFTKEQVVDVMNGLTTDVIRHVYQFKTWEIDIDFNNPENYQNQLVDWTNEVEADSPLVRAILPNLEGENIGEGIVYTAVSSSVPEINVSGLRLKVKGEKHSVSKVKTLAEVDEVKLNSVKEFVDMVATKNRLEQGVDVLKQRGLDVDPKNTGEYIKWVMGDVLKEESGAMVNSGLCTKDVTGAICSIARQYWMNLI